MFIEDEISTQKLFLHLQKVQYLVFFLNEKTIIVYSVAFQGKHSTVIVVDRSSMFDFQGPVSTKDEGVVY